MRTLKEANKAGKFRLLFWAGVLAAQVAIAGGQGDVLRIGLGDQLEDFEVIQPTPGSGRVECGSAVGTRGWQVAQWNNSPDLSICTGSAESQCKGAVWSRGSSSMYSCAYKNPTRFQAYIDTSRLPHHGCCVYCSPDARAHPGGYSIKLEWKANRSPQKGHPLLKLRNLERLEMSLGQRILEFSSSDCSGAEIRSRIGPRDSLAHLHANLFFSAATPGARPRTIVFATYLWDSRTSENWKMKKYRNCGFPSGKETWTVVGLPISEFDAVSNHGILRWDILPALEKSLEECHQGIDLAELELTGFYFGNEIFNDVKMSFELKNPEVILTGRGRK